MLKIHLNTLKSIHPLINDQLPDEQLLQIASFDEWYSDILTYLRTQKFSP